MLLSFLLSSLIIAATPGIATIYVLNNSASLGRKEGILSALGIMTGGMIYNILAAIGLSSIIYIFPNMLSLIKIVGGLYLVYIGIVTLKSKQNNESSNASLVLKNDCYIRGVITNLANPKILLFFVTFIPQFVINTNNYAKEALLLGTAYLIVEIIWFICLASFVSHFIKNIKGNFQKYMTYISSGVYLTMGSVLILSI
ncbi:LysE family translocator (plasmid) [Cetobacterium somerae]|uniref:LysE family translocator n=1 Tax=Cetobacterium somerae TaxID=188913 RepID=UPI001F05BE39|nr:LysE family translocator [Cetobacterium somerae]UPO98943.1 LysE family translocator [Cetobacterium somerae]